MSWHLSATFLPWIDDFWFVDVGDPPDSSAVANYPLEDQSETQVEGQTIRTKEPFSLTVRQERYRKPTGGTFTIHAGTGRGYDALRAVFGASGRKISVFFHRGDSPGEGGSNFYWLGRKRIRNVLAHLEPGGLIVSDGSLAIPRLRREFLHEDPAQIVSAAGSFEVAAHLFTCVGYLGERYGPTLVWKTSPR